MKRQWPPQEPKSSTISKDTRDGDTRRKEVGLKLPIQRMPSERRRRWMRINGLIFWWCFLAIGALLLYLFSLSHAFCNVLRPRHPLGIFNVKDICCYFSPWPFMHDCVDSQLGIFVNIIISQCRAYTFYSSY